MPHVGSAAKEEGEEGEDNGDNEEVLCGLQGVSPVHQDSFQVCLVHISDI